jgi:CBS domain-containing protein
MKEASKQMYQNNIGSVIVVDTEGNKKAVGIVTERDIARMVGFSTKLFSDILVAEIMSKPLITVFPDTSIKEAVILMQQKEVRRLPVLNDKGLMAGIITDKDILKAFTKTFGKTIKDHGLISEGFDLLGFLGAE